MPAKERGKSTLRRSAGDEALETDDGEEAEAPDNAQLRHKHRCARCNTAMDTYLIDEKRKLHVCGNNPDCPGYEVEHGWSPWQLRVESFYQSSHMIR